MPVSSVERPLARHPAPGVWSAVPMALVIGCLVLAASAGSGTPRASEPTARPGELVSRLRTGDGRRIMARFHVAPAAAPAAGLLLLAAPAGADEGPLARRLAALGFAVLVVRSRADGLPTPARIREDARTGLRALAARVPGRPLLGWAIGSSASACVTAPDIRARLRAVVLEAPVLGAEARAARSWPPLPRTATTAAVHAALRRLRAARDATQECPAPASAGEESSAPPLLVLRAARQPATREGPLLAHLREGAEIETVEGLEPADLRGAGGETVWLRAITFLALHTEQ